MSDELKPKVWWQTLPGVLTAIAAIVTAVTGLLIALHQIGVLEAGKASRLPAQVQTGEASAPRNADPSTARESSTALPTAGERDPVSLAIPASVRVDELTYEVLSATLDGHGPGTLSLKLLVRMTNDRNYPANFWVASFRILLGGVPRAPVNDLNEIVESHSAKEGVVEFVIPDATTEVGLQMGKVGREAPSTRLLLVPAGRD